MPTQQQISFGTYRKINGRWYKRCTGPAHEEPVYLPATEKYFYSHKTGRVGELVSRCRLCVNWAKLKSPGSNHGWVPIERARPYYEEAVNRVGLTELSRRAGIDRKSLLAVLLWRNRYVQKATLRKVMLELISMRRKGEASISNGAKWRRDSRVRKASRRYEKTLDNRPEAD